MPSVNRKPFDPAFPTDEAPLQYRTTTEHWLIYPRNGLILVHHLKTSTDGLRLEVGRRKFKITKKMIASRDDLATNLIRVLVNWRGGDGK